MSTIGERVVPETHLRCRGARLVLLGTIAGFAPDGPRVAAAARALEPDAVALGVPPEDLAGIEALADDPERVAELPELDGPEARFHELLARFGATAIPSPDLQEAHRAAAEAGVPLVAVDLDDETHTALYTRHLKVRHLWKRGRLQDRAMERDFAEAQDAHAFACAWDAALAGMAPLQAVEAAREEAMAGGIDAACKDHARVLAVVPAPRFAGVVTRLSAAGAMREETPIL